MKAIYEIFDEVSKAKNEQDRVLILFYNKGDSLLNVLRGTFDPRIKFVFSEIPKYKNSEAPAGLGYNNMDHAMKLAYLFEENNPRVSPNLSLKRKTELLIQLLEGMEKREAEVFANMLMKKQNVKGLTVSVVNKAFPDLIPTDK